jgi:hypothetical protein
MKRTLFKPVRGWRMLIFPFISATFAALLLGAVVLEVRREDGAHNFFGESVGYD